MNKCKRIVASIVFSFFAFAIAPTQAADEQKVAAQVTAPLNINQASADEIATRIKGIGLKRAQAIVDYRDEYGPFENIDELLDVKGVGKATLEKNRSKITL